MESLRPYLLGFALFLVGGFLLVLLLALLLFLGARGRRHLPIFQALLLLLLCLEIFQIIFSNGHRSDSLYFI